MEGHNHGGQNINPSAVELNPGSGAGHGGYIDFHYNGDMASDHTARIIESAKGVLNVVGFLTQNGTAVSLNGHTHSQYLTESQVQSIVENSVAGIKGVSYTLVSDVSTLPVEPEYITVLPGSGYGTITTYCNEYGGGGSGSISVSNTVQVYQNDVVQIYGHFSAGEVSEFGYVDICLSGSTVTLICRITNTSSSRWTKTFSNINIPIKMYY